MTLRKAVFACHLTAGAVAGSVVLVMAVTGVLLAYERQIVDWADGHRLAPALGAARLPPETLLARAREARPGAPLTTVTLRSRPDRPAAFGLGRAGTLFVDPYDGRVLGEGSPRARAFFRAVTDWHRALGGRGERRGLGRALTGGSNLAFLFLVMSGFYLWWPRSWSRRVTSFRRGLSGRARDFNWHNVVGFWSAVPLLLIVASAATISYPWAGNLVYRLSGESPPPPPRRAPEDAERDAPRLEGLDAAWAIAEQRDPAWQAITLRLPAAGRPATFTIDSSTSGVRPDLRAQLTVDLATGEVVRWEPYASQSRGRRIRAWMRWIHTGEAGGMIGQTLAGLASAGAAVLVWTGLALAWRRGWAWARRRRDPDRAQAEASAPSPTRSVQPARNAPEPT